MAWHSLVVEFSLMAIVAEEYEMLQPTVDLNQQEEFEDTDAILKRLMPVLPIFTGKNFKLWAIKMEGLLGSIDLWICSRSFYEFG